MKLRKTYGLSIAAACLALGSSYGFSTAQTGAKKPTKSSTQAKPTPGVKAAPNAAQIALGKKAYESNGCGGCHAISGKGGNAGPDLTNTGGNKAHTAAWFTTQIVTPKKNNPGSTMPPFPGIKAAELTALSVYLTSLSPSTVAAMPGGAKLAPPSPLLVAKIEKAGGTVRQIAQNDDHLEVDFHMTGPTVTDASILPLATLKNVVELNLGKTSVTDAGLAHIKGMTGLTMLHLENSKITDKGLAMLMGMKNLTYLNLYGTAVTDDGIQELASLPKLQKLYVWQTKVTKAGADKLKVALPKLEIVLGFDAK
ncbi:MAG: c-type cytochrome [Chthonomonadales bacterium]